jgi:hypothetical protein
VLNVSRSNGFATGGKNMSELARGLLVCACAVVGLSFSTTQSSAAVPVGTVIGVFSNPVYSGFVSNDPTVGQKTFYNNSATAPSTTIIGRNYIQWGVNPGLPFGTPYSMLTFTGNSYAPLIERLIPLTQVHLYVVWASGWIAPSVSSDSHA